MSETIRITPESSPIHRSDLETLLLTQDEAARFLKVTTRTIRRWAREGRIQQINVGGKAVRYPTDSVLAFIARNSTTEVSDGTP